MTGNEERWARYPRRAQRSLIFVCSPARLLPHHLNGAPAPYQPLIAFIIAVLFGLGPILPPCEHAPNKTHGKLVRFAMSFHTVSAELLELLSDVGPEV